MVSRHLISFWMMAAVLSLIFVGNNVSLTPKAYAATAKGQIDACKCVIFRLDDIQDSWMVSIQSAIMDKFIERNQILNLAIIMNSIGNDPAIVNKVKESIETGLVEPTLHGWDHIDYRTLSLQQQQSTIEKANQKMEDLFGTTSETFVAPYNAYNENTLKAANQAGIKILSSEFDQEIESIYNSDEPDSPTNKVFKAIAGSDIRDQFGVYHLPQVIGFYTYDSEPPTKTPLTSMESQVANTIASYGYAVVTLHPQDFTVKDSTNNPTDTLSSKEMDDLDTLLTWINDQGYHTSAFSNALHFQTHAGSASDRESAGQDTDNRDRDDTRSRNDVASNLVAPLVHAISSSIRLDFGKA